MFIDGDLRGTTVRKEKVKLDYKNRSGKADSHSAVTGSPTVIAESSIKVHQFFAKLRFSIVPAG